MADLRWLLMDNSKSKPSKPASPTKSAAAVRPAKLAARTSAPQNRHPTPKLRGYANIPALFSTEIIKLNGGTAVFECKKREFTVFAELNEEAMTRGQGQLPLTKAESPAPIVILQTTDGLEIIDGEVEIRSAQIPRAIFGRVNELKDNDVIVCVVTPYDDLPFLAKSISAVVDPVRVRYGTLYERVKLNDYWTELEVMSEPFVNNESFGYCPVIHVRTRTGENKYLQVSPRSIRDILESMRSSGTGLIGIKLRIRKKTAAQESGFEGYRIAKFS
jgi:hypothetical protein